MGTRQELERLLGQLDRGDVSRREFVVRALALGLSLGSVGFLLQACKGRGQAAAGGDSAAAEPAMADLGPIEKELHIYNWSDYIAEDTVPNFEKEFGVKVSYDTYESNEEMVAKLQAGAGGYDIVVPSGYIIPVMVATDLVSPINKKYITHWGNVSPIFQNLPTDPGNRYTVPWQWGTTGIAYRSDRVKSPVDSWGVFHDKRFAKKMTMMDDSREVIGSQLRYRGHSLNSTDPAELAQAKADSIAAKKNLKAYISAPVKAQLISGDVLIAQLWNGDTSQAKAEQPNLGYVIPQEGASIWADSMVIPRSASNKRAAHEWMNYILRPEVGAALSEATGYGTPNAAAAQVMKDPLPYPSEDELKRLEYQVDLGKDTETWDRIWTEINSA
ncbi:MAG TPA: spermidine/putrescine ABC transporter substrate-binding protein [Gemmatimonadales bacterium]|nr:spermidine/putrescine ABC transporter substrate-binding protein [Gemmatimonadales bacterium]